MPFPSPGDLPNPGIKLISPAQAGGFYTTEPQGRPNTLLMGPEEANTTTVLWGHLLATLFSSYLHN